MEMIIILLLILINGVFAMAEIAVVSSRKARLQQQADEGDSSAKAALHLAESPNRFLSTVQIGITFVGIFAGAFGGDTVAQNLSNYFATMPVIEPMSDVLGLLIVVALITYLSLVIGELVPKRIALNHPETLAKFLSRPMNALSSVVSPLVSLLTLSTDWILRILQINPSSESQINEDEVRLLIREGARVGVFNIEEKDIVERTFRLGDRKVDTLMTPRNEIAWIDIDSSFKKIRQMIAEHPHAHFPICRDTLDKIVGVIRTEDLLTDFLVEEKINVKKSLHKPTFIPETMEALKVLEIFKKTGIHMALIIDEYGSILGLITLSDILTAIVGDIPNVNELEEQSIMKRQDGTFLVDGLVSIDEFKEYFLVDTIPGEHNGEFHTIGGFMMTYLGRLPVSGDKVELGSCLLEVVDMDINRVDKILVSLQESQVEKGEGF